MIEATQQLIGGNVDKTQVVKMCKTIADKITVPIEKLNDHAFNELVAVKIALACQHPKIFDSFPIHKFVILKCVQMKKSGL